VTYPLQRFFPFAVYFSDSPDPLFGGVDYALDLQSAEGCFCHMERVFEELRDYRAFELLRTQGLRGDYLLTKQTRIVAMTCTHAAMTRRRLVELGFKYDSLIMEEAAQVLEVETLVPMLLQDTDPVDGCRLKRVVLIGDHHQLPPVVKHAAFQKFSRFDQSLFSRFVRLGVPTVTLDKQGRARAEIAALYSWRYATNATSLQPSMGQLGNLDSISQRVGEFAYANAGFVHTRQMIDVPAFKGKGEICPTPYFYQNLGEAEYVVAVYQYMRLIGYPAEKITILTTYNGQKHLVRDILAQRCRNPVFGFPASVSTVDKYQGQQNDYVLLSLVRTEAVGHVRDVRRLVVAMSRARLGLYVFCRRALFENCYELSPAISQLLDAPTSLQLVAGEGYPTQRAIEEVVQGKQQVYPVSDVTAMGVLVYQMVQQSAAVSDLHALVPIPVVLVEQDEVLVSMEEVVEGFAVVVEEEEEEMVVE
jgi:intron-binding protein aquarius